MALLGLGASGAGQATELYQEYASIIKPRDTVAPLDEGAFGDQTNLYTGETEVVVTDIDLKGNDSLPVRLIRRTGIRSQAAVQLMGDWSIEVPMLKGTFARSVGWVADANGGGTSGATAQRCSVVAAPPMAIGARTGGGVSDRTSLWDAAEFWYGNELHLPGAGDALMLGLVDQNQNRPADGKTYRWTTRTGWYFSCLPALASGQDGEGFLGVAPDGTRYWFDWMVRKEVAEDLTKPGYSGPQAILGATVRSSSRDVSQTILATVVDSLARSEVSLYVSRIEDRFGNAVTFQYDAAYPERLVRVAASDGRAISLHYGANGSVDWVKDGAHEWDYGYSGGQLQSVKLPDGSYWHYSGKLSLAPPKDMPPPSDPGYTWYCDHKPAVSSPSPRTTTFSITHPSGATEVLNLEAMAKGRSYVPRACVRYQDPLSSINDAGGYAMYPRYSLVYSITGKSISGPGLLPMAWTYAYGPENGSWSESCSSTACPTTINVEVQGPAHHWRRFTYGNRYDYDEGKLLRVEEGTGPDEILRTRSIAYNLVRSGQPYPTPMGENLVDRSVTSSAYYEPEKSATIVQDGVGFTRAVQSYDAFARPSEVSLYNSLGYSRNETTVYYDQTSSWVLGQPKTVTCTAPASCKPASAPNGIVISQTDYDAVSALPIRNYVFGKLRQTIAYNPDGTVRTVQDGAGTGHAITLGNWKRGIPQSISYPSTPDQPTPAVESAVVNDDGTLASTTDETGAKTCFSYDPMGRLAGVTFPSEASNGLCDTSTWAQTTQTFKPATVAEYGIPAGHWKQTISTGNARQVTYYDAFWRPLVEERYDAAGAASTRSINVKRYDASGRLVFQGLPSSTLVDYNTVTAGTTATYDVLDRITSTSLSSTDSATGVFTTTTNYLPGFRTRVTNARGYATVTAYEAWDQPSTDYPVDIDAADGTAEEVDTDIARDAFGKPLSIARRSPAGTVQETRSYVYDTAQELCKTVEPETGATLVSYDAAGNLAWSASGQSLPNTANCDLQYVPGASKVTRSYDARNRLLSLLFPDHRGDTIYRYAADGLISSLTADNGGADQVTTSYGYNHRRLLVSERLQWGAIDWSLGYGFNANGHLASLDYPDGTSVSYLPNALGQPTQAGSYAKAVSYYPNGGVRQFTYGNGIVHTLAQNDRQLPERSQDAYSGVPVLDDSYDYDGNGNVAAISDGLPGNRGNRSMAYDGLDRLRGVASAMYGSAGAHYDYDALDNLTHVAVGGTAARDQYYCYDAAWRLTNIKTGGCSGATVVGLGYDAQGNLANKNGQTFTFDYGNRLRAVSGSPASSYVYDGNGRRVRDFTTASKYSLYSRAGMMLFDSDGRLGLQHDDIFLGGSLVAIRERKSTTGAVSVKYQHTDALGSPVTVTDASRNLLERTEYEPYGKVLNRPVHDGPGYTGHVEDAATGLEYMQQRYYDPGIGSFLSVDPVMADGNTGGNFNRYWYANNNPYLFTDPDGRKDAVAWLVKLTATGMRKVSRLTMEQAVRARRAGESVLGVRRQVSHQIETAAHGSEGQLKHAGHELADGFKGLPHYQTEGVTGHTFWGQLSVGALAIAGALDKAAEAADAFDPLSAATHVSEAGQPGVTHECQNGCTDLPQPTEPPREPDEKPVEPPKKDMRRPANESI